MTSGWADRAEGEHTPRPRPISPRARPVRLLRATAAGGGSACLGVAAHVAAGGRAPGVVLCVVAGALLVRLAYGLTGRRRGLPAIVGALAGSQLALHVAFTVNGHATAAGDHHHELTPAELFVERDGHGLTGPILMIVLHLAAVLLTALLLHHADRMIWATDALHGAVTQAAPRLVAPFAVAASRLRRALARLTAGCLAPSLPTVGFRAARTTPPRPRSVPLGRAARRRGPPPADPGRHYRLAA